MSNSIACDDPSGVVIAGVDTHKHKHVAVAIKRMTHLEGLREAVTGKRVA